MRPQSLDRSQKLDGVFDEALARAALGDLESRLDGRHRDQERDLRRSHAPKKKTNSRGDDDPAVRLPRGIFSSPVPESRSTAAFLETADMRPHIRSRGRNVSCGDAPLRDGIRDAFAAREPARTPAPRFRKVSFPRHTRPPVCSGRLSTGAAALSVVGVRPFFDRRRVSREIRELARRGPCAKTAALERHHHPASERARRK